MTEQIIRSRTLTRPALTPRPGTLLDVATVQTSANAWTDKNGLWDTLNCGDLNNGYADQCLINPGGPAPAAKTFDAPEWVDGFRFAAYKGTTCKMIDFAYIQSLNTQAFLDFESASVEAVFGAHVIEVATNLTPATALTVKEGLALLEGHAGTHYAGVPTIHASTQILSLLDSDGASLEVGAGGFRTAAGSKVVNGGGYFGVDKATPVLGAGEAWLFATGEVVLQQSGEINEASAAAPIKMDTNEVQALTERIYLAGYDCYATAVRVKVYG